MLLGKPQAARAQRLDTPERRGLLGAPNPVRLTAWSLNQKGDEARLG